MFKKNQKNRAFFAAITMLLISAIVITTASFAWFTLGRSAMASNLDLKVTKQGEGIQISANASAFTDEIAFEELNGTGGRAEYRAPGEDYNYFPAEISPASSKFSLSALPAFFAGGVDRGTDTLESLATTSDDGVTIYGKSGAEVPAGSKAAGYYVFDVFINYTGGESAQIKMSSSDITVRNDESDGTQAIAEAVDAMRIGFVDCGTVDQGTTTQATSGTKAVIFATNADARNTAPIASTGVSGVLADGAYTVPQSAEGSLTVAPAYDCAVDTGAEDAVLTVEQGVNRIRVYIWMEGQDANCTDSLQSQLISANLVFTLV